MEAAGSQGLTLCYPLLDHRFRDLRFWSYGWKSLHVNGVQSLQKMCWYESPTLRGCTPDLPQLSSGSCFLSVYLLPVALTLTAHSFCLRSPGNHSFQLSLCHCSALTLLLLREGDGQPWSLDISCRKARREPETRRSHTHQSKFPGCCYPGFLELPNICLHSSSTSLLQ